MAARRPAVVRQSVQGLVLAGASTLATVVWLGLATVRHLHARRLRRRLVLVCRRELI